MRDCSLPPFPQLTSGFTLVFLGFPRVFPRNSHQTGFKLLLHLLAAPWDSSRLFPLSLLSLCEQSSWQHMDWDNVLTHKAASSSSVGVHPPLPSVRQVLERKESIHTLLSQEGFPVSRSCPGA